jgi:hypothetical protein
MQFHCWEYTNRNQTHMFDTHRPFICSVVYINQPINTWLILYSLLIRGSYSTVYNPTCRDNSFINGSYSKPTVNKGLLLYSLKRQFIHKWLLLYKGNPCAVYLPLFSFFIQKILLFKPAYFVGDNIFFCVFCAFRRYFPLPPSIRPNLFNFSVINQVEN